MELPAEDKINVLEKKALLVEISKYHQSQAKCNKEKG